MYLATNREILREEGSGRLDEVFGDRPNALGPNELRVARVFLRKGKIRVEMIKDELTAEAVATIRDASDLKLEEGNYYVDLKVAAELSHWALTEKKNILIFVHGFNNDVEDVVRRALQLEEHFGVVVLPFSWPANGGGLKGVIDYKEDKNDAKISTVALDRLLTFVGANLKRIRTSRNAMIQQQVQASHPSNPEKRDALYARLLEKECPFTINLMLHSMGNYLLKQTFKSTVSQGVGLTFDNVIMAAADVNNADHASWVDRIRFRNRLYITINENDFALQASRAKSGQEQLARLGHVVYRLNAERATYINFTGAPYVKNSHAYFEGAALRNKAVRQFFTDALNGRTAENRLRYRSDLNCYELI